MNPRTRIVCGVGAALVVIGIGSLHYVSVQPRLSDAPQSWDGITETSLLERLAARLAERGQQLSEVEKNRVLERIQSELGPPLKHVYFFGWAACAVGFGVMVSSWAWPRRQEPRQ